MLLYLSTPTFYDSLLAATKDVYERHNIVLKYLTSFWNYTTWNKREEKFKIKEEYKTLESLRKFTKETGIPMKLMLDSGVFSARLKGMKIPNELLAEFYHKNSDLFNIVMTNDEGTPETQIENTRILKSLGVPVVGIYHPGSIERPFMTENHLQQLLELTDFNSIAMFTIPKSKRMFEVDRMFNFIYKHGYEKNKIHMLGIESANYLLRFPFYSADATSFLRDGFTGCWSMWDDKRLKIDRINVKDNINYCIRKNMMLVNGVECEKNIHTGVRMYENIYIRSIYQKFLTDVWQKRGIEWS